MRRVLLTYALPLTAALVLMLAAGTRPAQASGFPDAGSFLAVTSWHDITASLTGLDLTVGLGADPYFVYNGVQYDVAEIWTVGVIDDQNGLGSTTGTAVGDWAFHTQDGANSNAAGWTNPSKSEAITPNTSKTFTFTSLIRLADLDGYALHVSLDGQNFPGTTGLTGGIRLTGLPPESVPEPAFYQLAGLLGLGGLSLLRFRRKRA